MKKQTISLSIFFALSIVSISTIAHDPSLHKKTAEKPNCAAMKDMDHSELETDDPVMRAMMAKCRSQTTEAETLEKYPLTKSKTKYRPKIGHQAPMLDSAPDHEQQDHRKVYEVADCENMSNMHHSETTDAFDPITQEMMEQCEKKSSPSAEKTEHDEGHHE